MWAALALTTVLNLASAEADGLKIENVRFTHGVLGAKRTDESFIPGEIAVVSFDIHGLKPKRDGEVNYKAGFELIRKKDKKSLMTKGLVAQTAINSLGGSAVPAVTFVRFGLDTDEGAYVIKVTIENPAGKKAVLQKEVEITKKKFGFVQVRFMAPTVADNPLPAPPIAVPGQAIHVRFALANFAGDKDGQCDLDVEMAVKDAAGKETVAPAKAAVKQKFDKKEPLIDFRPIPLQLNRPGKYKVVFKAKDKEGKTSAEQTLDLEVLKN